MAHHDLALHGRVCEPRQQGAFIGRDEEAPTGSITHPHLVLQNVKHQREMAKHPLGTHGEYTKIECTVKVLQRSITFRFLMPLFMGASSAGEDWFLLDKPADNVALQCSEFKNFKRVNANAVTLISLVPWLAFSSAPSL